MTFREDKNRASSKVEATSQADARSSARPPPGNLDPTLGPVDWDEVEMQDFQRMLDVREERREAKKK